MKTYQVQAGDYQFVTEFLSAEAAREGITLDSFRLGLEAGALVASAKIGRRCWRARCIIERGDEAVIEGLEMSIASAQAFGRLVDTDMTLSLADGVELQIVRDKRP